MKIDRTKLKKSSSEAPGDCGWLIEKITSCKDDELASILQNIDTWSFGKCELHHWVNVLDRFDSILEKASNKTEDTILKSDDAPDKIEQKWVLHCDKPENIDKDQDLVVCVLYFTTLLVEHSFSRHLYSSVEHLITLTSSSSMRIVLAVLNLLYMFSKRSNFITRLGTQPRQCLLSRLIYLAESWGGKENGFGLAQCCQKQPLTDFPEGATTLHFEFYGEQAVPVPADSSTVNNQKSTPTTMNSTTTSIHIENVQNLNKAPGEIMEDLLNTYKIPKEKQMVLFTHLRLAHSFARYTTRLQCVQARLQAISILVYCNALQDNAYTVLYSGLLDEFVEVLELQDQKLTEIKAATLRTLTSIIHLERMPNFPKLSTIIDVTGASCYHGFLPVLVRSCISSLTAPSPNSQPFPSPLATSLFSFLYHLASYESGGEALVACGMMDSLLQVVNWVGTEPEHITFVTRAVRVIDLITNPDMNAFQTHGGLNTFIKRLELEVNECRKEQPFVIHIPTPLGTEPSQANNLLSPDQDTGSSSDTPNIDNPNQTASNDSSIEAPQATSTPRVNEANNDSEAARPIDSDMSVENVDEAMPRDSSTSPMDTSEIDPSNATEEQPTSQLSNLDVNVGASTSTASLQTLAKPVHSVTCLPQRAALLKSMLNFLKKDIQDPVFSESMRHLMEGSLPASLKHIISNAEYYGPSLFLLATDVVTVYVLGEPSLLSSLQDSGLTDIVLHALLVKDVPATREVIGSLPNVFSALCLNTRGLQAFVACKPFERLFKVLLSPDYLPAMRRRRSSDPLGDTASNLGNAMDELMRHQPSLKAQAMKAIVKLLEEVCLLGSDAHYVCWKAPPKHEASPLPTSRPTNDNSSDEEDEEEDGESGVNAINNQEASMDAGGNSSGEKRPVPLVDYVLNVMKFVEAILSNNNTDDHCKEFVAQKGLVPLLGILGLSNLPIDFPASTACQAVASVCKSILNLAHESGVLQQGLGSLNDKLESLEPLHQPLPPPGGSVLLRELASSPQPLEAGSSPQNTPLLHTLSAIHAYIMMLVYVCRTGQTDIRQVSIKQWGTELGLNVLKGLTKLYTSLVFESTVLLAMCSPDGWKEMPDGLFGKDDGNRLVQPENRVTDFSQLAVPMETSDNVDSEDAAVGASGLTDGAGNLTTKPTTQQQVKCIKPLLSSASRLGKALAELFGLLVKLCVGSPLRQRRGQTVAPPLSAPSPAAVSVASALSRVLHAGLSWDPPPSSPLPKFRLTFLICSVRFTNPMLFDDKKMPYHLMIQHFVKSKSLDAFFDIFNWALSTMESLQSKQIEMESSDKTTESNNDKDIRDGIGEFLDTWLFLLEKLVNPKMMLDSPHSLPSKQSFCPLKFLIHIQKLAFDAVLRLWNQKPGKNYNVSISESVLVILCSILKGEAIIKDRLIKEKAATSVTPPVSGAPVSTFSLNPVTAHSSSEASVIPTSGSGNDFPVIVSVASMASSLGDDFPVIVSVASMASSLGNVSTNYLAPITCTDTSFSNSSFILIPSSSSTSSVTSPTSTSVSTTESISTVSTVATSRPLIIPSPVMQPTDLSVGASPPVGIDENTGLPTLIVRIPLPATLPASDPAPTTAPIPAPVPVPPPSSVLSSEAQSESIVPTLPLETSAPSNEESVAILSSVVAGLNASSSTESRDSVSTSIANATASTLGLPYLQALLDMGFPQERCLEAVAHTTTLEQATEYLLSNPAGAQADGEMDLVEDDQWLQAMAMSLCDNVQPVTSKPPTAPTRTEPQPPLPVAPIPNEEPLSKSRLNDFTEEVLEGCLTQLDHQPQLVYKACELLTTCVNRNGEKWKAFMLLTLMDQISEQACELKIIAFQARTPDTAQYLCTSETANKFGIRLHLVTLLFEEMKRGCAVALEIAGLIDILVDLVCLSELVMSANPNIVFTVDKIKEGSNSKKKAKDELTHSPQWLAPAMLLLDLYEKLSVATKRRAAVKNVTNHVWKWFDLSAMKWYGYTHANNTTIDDAYWNGETSVRIVNVRRKYTIQFSNMMQINEETSNRRPVMITVSEKVIAEHKKKLQDVSTDDEKIEEKNKDTAELAEPEKDVEKPLELVKTKESTEEEKMDTEEVESKVKSKDEGFSDNDPDTDSEEKAKDEAKKKEEDDKCFGGFATGHRGKLVRACVGFMKLCIDPDTLHALMRLCLRLTRDWELACLFSSLGGVRTLLSLTEKSAFWGFHNLAALLMRHVLEEPAALKHTMKKVVRYSAGSSTGIAAKELHSLLRVLAPVACRDSALFTEIAQQCLRIDLSMAMKRNLVNSSSSEDGILMKSIGSKTGPVIAPIIADSSEPQLLVHDLVEALAYSGQEETSATPSGVLPSTPSMNVPVQGTSSEGISLSIQTSTEPADLSRSSSANDMVVVQDIEDQSPVGSISPKPDADATPEAQKLAVIPNNKKTLLSKSTLCKLLAEFVRSYAGVAKIITEHQYSAGVNERITEDCSALSYMLDTLVWGHTTGYADTEMVNNVRVLIAALASCNHAMDAQTILVTEVKSCLSRVLSLPESPDKHTKIQALVGLAGTMMEACPSHINQALGSSCFKPNQLGMNNMIRIMIKKNLVTDLARIPHCLDLSSPNMAATINAALKPLETVLRIVNMPSFIPVAISKKKTSQQEDTQPTAGSVTTSSEATRAQGEENAEDAENTEHDISGAVENMDHNEESNQNEDGPLVEGDEVGLEEIFDQLLDNQNRTSGDHDSDNITAAVTYVLEHDRQLDTMDTDDTMHDSQMVSHSESQMFDLNEDGGNDDNDDSSGSSEEDNEDADDNEDEEEEGEDDEEDDDGDDEEDNEDDEEGSVIDEYDDFEEAFIRLPGERYTDDILFLPSYQQYIDTIDNIIFGDRSPMQHQALHDDSIPMSSTPVTPASTIPTHPLFQDPREVQTAATVRAGVGSGRLVGRQRRVLGYHTTTPRSQNSTSTMLQRLLGQSHRDVLQLTSNLREATQLFIANPDVILLQSDPDDFLETQDTGPSQFPNTSRGNASASLPNVPNALSRWLEEAKVLEADSMQDAVTEVKPALMAVLEHYKEVEVAEREKKKKELDAAKGTKEKDDKVEENEGSTPIEVSTSSTSTATSTTSSAPPLSNSVTFFFDITSSLTSTTATTTSTLAQTSTTPFASQSANLIMSILEQQFRTSGSGAEANRDSLSGLDTTAPSFSGLLTQLSSSGLDSPQMSVQEALSGPLSLQEPFTTATPEFIPASDQPETSAASFAITPLTPINPAPDVTCVGSTTVTPSTQPSDTAPPFVSPPVLSPISPPLPPVFVQPPPLPHSPQEEAMVVSPPEALGESQPQNLVDISLQEHIVVDQTSGQSASPDLDCPVELIPVPPSIPIRSLEGWAEEPETLSDLMSEVHRHVVSILPTTVSAVTPVTSSITLATSTSSASVQRPSSEFSSILGDIEIPEGVDPSFLAALPEEMRQEVIAEQLRIQRVRQRATEAQQETTSPSVGEVNPEFLAALPPNIQEEILENQRLEQQRQRSAAANPEEPVNAASFLQTLSQSLRQTILADLEDSQFSALPADVAQEAQSLRRAREERSRHIHDHIFPRTGGTAMRASRLGNRFLHSSNWPNWGVRSSGGTASAGTSSNQGVTKARGQQLLDHESLSCLLVLLFVDEPKLNTVRLHRVLKSLCQHAQTRDWLIMTLLSIIERCSELPKSSRVTESDSSITFSVETANKKSDKIDRLPLLTSTPTSSLSRSESKTPITPSWLSMSMDAALGCRANIFQIYKSNTFGKKTPAPSSGTSVHIHAQASPLVCRHAIDLLISLAKSFPSHFLPTMKEPDASAANKKLPSTSTSQAVAPSSGAVLKGSKAPTASQTASSISQSISAMEGTDFWDLLVKLDSATISRKGKGIPRIHQTSLNVDDQMDKVYSLESSPLGQLIQQLAHPVVRRSSLLTDRLLRLLALVSLGLSDMADSVANNKKPVPTENSEHLEKLLALAIEVLTSKSCSEEGLEDATALLLHLSHGPPPARDLVLRLLLQGAFTLGQTVTAHISTLLEELRQYNLSHPSNVPEEEVSPARDEKSRKGVLKDRFTLEDVVIATNSKNRSPREVQLPSMSILTSKTSSQAFFLRTLKVIIQLREGIRKSKTKKHKISNNLQLTHPIVLARPAQNTEMVDSILPSADGESVVVEQSIVIESPPETVQESAEATESVAPTTDSSVPVPVSVDISVVESLQNYDNTTHQEVPVSNDQMEVSNGEPAINNLESQSSENAAQDEAMDIDQDSQESLPKLKSLGVELSLDELWSTLSQCLVELGETPDAHAVLVLQPAVEAFFLVHASAAAPDKKKIGTSLQESREAQLAHIHHEIAPLSPLPSTLVDDDSPLSQLSIAEADAIASDAEKFLKFAETHRSVLNQILRQSTTHLSDGPFNVLVDHTRLLDFDIKRKYFRTELERADEGVRREDLAIHVRREHVFEDSFRELHRRSMDEWKNRFYIVFEGEEGQDAGGLLREWYVIISREIFNPMYALFCTSPGDRVTYMINPSSHCNSNHLSYFKFVGRVIAKAIYDNKLLECYFTRSFYKHILGKMVRVQDMEIEDYSFYQGLIYLIEHEVSDLGYDLTFSTEVQEFGVTEVRDLKPNGRNITVTEETKFEYIRLVCQEKMTGAIRKQIISFLEGFFDIIPKRLISIFNEQELELLLSGLPTIDIDDLKNNTEYHKYHPSSLQIQWFWRTLRSFDQAERAKLVQFVTGTSKVPLQGFAALEGMNGTQKFQIHRDDRATDRLPSAHTCFNQLDLPVYETYDKLRHYLLKAIQECSEGFGFA